MDFLNQAIAQVSDLFRSMTPGAGSRPGCCWRSSWSASATCSSISRPGRTSSCSAASICRTASSTRSKRPSPRPASTATPRRQSHPRAGRPAGRVPRRRRRWRRPAAQFQHDLENALDKGGPWESSEATRERLKIARQQMLGEIVRDMDWVEDAVVLYDEQQPRGLSPHEASHRARSTSSRSSAKSLDPRRASMLQKLVAHAVVGMRAEDVVVTSLGDESGIGADGDVYPESFDDEYYQTRVAFEQYKKQQHPQRACATSRASASKSTPSSTTRSRDGAERQARQQGTALHDAHRRRNDRLRHRRRRRPAGRHRPRPESPRRPAATAQRKTRARRPRRPTKPTTSSARNNGSSADRLHAEGSLGHGHDSAQLRRNDLEAAQPDAKDAAEGRRPDASCRTNLITKVEEHRRAAADAAKQGRGPVQASPRRDRRFASACRTIVPPSLASKAHGLDRPLLEHAGDARRRHVQPARAASRS